MSNLNQPIGLDIGLLVTSLNGEVEDRLNALKTTPEDYASVLKFLTYNLQSIRFNMCNDVVSVGDIWKGIRSNGATFDLVVDLTTSLRLYANTLDRDGWNKLCVELSESFGSFNNSNTSSELAAVEDEGELALFVEPATALKLIQSNPWMATLFFIRRCPEVQLLMAEVAKKAVGQNQSEGA